MPEELSTISPSHEGMAETERQEGVIVERQGSGGLDLTDEEFNAIVSGRMDDAVAWWNNKIGLDENRAIGEKYYKNDVDTSKNLHDHQVDYKNNRILVDIESLVPMAAMNMAEPIITEANDTDASRQLAMDLGNVEMAFYEDSCMKAKITKIARHLLMGKRIGIIKYWFDPNQGKILPDGSRKGAIIFEVRRPEKIVIAEQTGPNENPLFIGEYMSGTIEDLIIRFPDKKADILKEQGITVENKKNIQKTVGYIEYHFTYYNKQSELGEGIGWKLGDTVLGKIATPNWNDEIYEIDEATGNAVSLNFFDSPQKPYIFFNHIDTDEWIYDETALIDHAIPLQDVLNKRGRQIVENADHAEGGMVYNTQMISQEDMAKVIGDSTEKIGVDGPVNEAIGRVQHNMLPNYVIQDKMDARAEIDNIFGSNAPIKGESSGLDTLGQEILSQRANLGRLQPIADTIEDGMDKVYKAHIQMMKVWWDEPESVRFTASDGSTNFINWSGDKIEDGVKVRVKSGSALPKDKFAIRNETVQMAASLDPLSIAEGLDKADPKSYAKRIVFYNFFMDRYLTEILGDGPGGTDQAALADLEALVAGNPVQVPDDVSKEYLATFDTFIRSNGFKVLEPDAKGRIVEFVISASNKAKAAMGEEPEEQQQIEQGGEPEANVAEGPVPPEGSVAGGTEQPAGGNIVQKGVSAVRDKLGI